VLNAENGMHITELWKDPGIQTTFERRGDFDLHIIDNAKFFLDKSGEIFSQDYVVTEEDALKCRVMTTGIREELFEMSNNFKMLMVDVGGQRSERKKWIQCFDGVSALLFVVAVSEFDQRLFEDSNINRFEESLRIWTEVITMKEFSEKMFILFLNKVDLFEEKNSCQARKSQGFQPRLRGSRQRCAGGVEVL